MPRNNPLVNLHDKKDFSDKIYILNVFDDQNKQDCSSEPIIIWYDNCYLLIYESIFILFYQSIQ